MAYSKSNYKEKKINEITENLQKTLDSFMSNNEKYKDFLKTMSKFHNYSLNNLLLITDQRPDATNVAGYNSWKNDFNRQVKKGAKSIKIIAPVIKKEWVEVKDKDGKLQYDSQGRTKKQKQSVIRGYRAVNVFDISDTTGKPITTAKDLINDSLQDSNDFKDLYEEFKSFINSNGLSVTEKSFMDDDIIRSGSKGYYHVLDNYIVIDEDLSYDHKFKTLIHEYTHANLHNLDNDNYFNLSTDVTKSIREIEAESTAFVVCNYYGLDTSDYSIGYLGAYASILDEKVIKHHISAIKLTSTEIINEINNLPNFSRFIENKMQIDTMKEENKQLNSMIDTNLKNGIDKITIIKSNLIEKFNFEKIDEKTFENDKFKVTISNDSFNVNNYKDTSSIEIINKLDDTFNKTFSVEQKYHKNLVNNTCKIVVTDLNNKDKKYIHERDLEGNILDSKTNLTDEEEIISFEKFINDSLKKNGLENTLVATMSNCVDMGYKLDIKTDDVLEDMNFIMIKNENSIRPSVISAQIDFDGDSNAFGEFKIRNSAGIKVMTKQETKEEYEAFTENTHSQQNTEELDM